MNGERIWVHRVQLTGRDVAGVVTTYNFADHAFTTSPTHPLIPNTYVPGSLVQPLRFERTMYGKNKTRGQVPIAQGSMALANTGGELDFMGALAFDVQAVELYEAPLDDLNSEYSIWRGTAESVICDESSVKVLVREATYKFDIPFQPTKFAGNNVLPNGLEGTAEDLKGKPKPVALGESKNFTPSPVNTSTLIYQLTDYQVNAAHVLSVLDGRVPIPVSLSLTLAQLDTAPYRKYFYCNNATFGATHVYVLAGQGAVPGDTFTADGASNPDHGLTTGDAVYFHDSYPSPPYSGGLATHTPSQTPLKEAVLYYVNAGATKWFTVHTTLAAATAGTGALVWQTTGNEFYQEITKNITIPGKYDWHNGATGLFIRLGSSPYAEITCDLTEPDTDDLPGALANLLARVSARGFGDFTLLNYIGQSPYPAIASQALGIFVDQETKMYQVIEQLCMSLNASFASYPAPGAGHYLVVARLEPGTSETAMLTIEQGDIIGAFSRLPPADQERATPPHKANINYEPNYTIQKALPGAPGDLAFTQNAYRTKAASHAALLTQFPAAPEMQWDTLLANEASATLLGSYFVGTSPALYSSIRDILVVTLPLRRIITDVSTSLPTSGAPLVLTGISGLVMGKPVVVALTRFARTMRLIGYDVDVKAATIQLTLWG